MMAMKFSIIALILVALLAAVSNRGDAEASEVWPGPGGVTATDGMYPGDAVLTWSTVEKAAYYRIGWIAGAEYQARADGGADWQEGFVFIDVANRGQASHLVTGLMPGEAYRFVVASHDGPIPTLLLPPAGVTPLQLREGTNHKGYALPWSPAGHSGSALATSSGTFYGTQWSVTPQHSEVCTAGDSFSLSSTLEETVTSFLCQDKQGDDYRIFVPTNYTTPDSIATQIHSRTKDGMQNRDKREEIYRTLILELAVQKALQDRGREDVYFDYLETGKDVTESAEQIVTIVKTAYDLADLGTTLAENSLTAHVDHVLKLPGLAKGLKFGSHTFDIAIAAAVNRTIDYQAALRNVDLLEQLDDRMDPAWPVAIDLARKDVNRMVSEEVLENWAQALDENKDDIKRTLITIAATESTKVAFHALGVKLGIATGPITAVAALSIIGTIAYIYETADFWEQLSLATTVAQVYWHMYQDEEAALLMTSVSRTKLLEHIKFSFYQHMYQAARNFVARLPAGGIDNVGPQKPSQFVNQLRVDRDLALKPLINSGWQPTEDFNIPLSETVVQPVVRPNAISSDGNTMWVSIRHGSTLLTAYDMEEKTRDASRDIDLTSHLPLAQLVVGLWYEHVDDRAYVRNGVVLYDDADKMWVAATQQADAKIHAYDITTGQFDVSRAFSEQMLDSVKEPTGIWGDDLTVWLSDSHKGKIFAYNQEYQDRAHAEDFDSLKIAGNTNPAGIWSDGETMWVADKQDQKVYAYDLSRSTRDITREFDLLNIPGVVQNTDPRGIWSDGATMWVADFNAGKIFAYLLPQPKLATADIPFARDPAADLGRMGFAGNGDAAGIWSDGTTMWVADHDDNYIYAYGMSSGGRVLKGFELDDEGFNLNPFAPTSGNNNATDIWSDGTTMWVADHHDDHVYAYRLSDGARIEDEEYDLRQDDVHARDARGIWFDTGKQTMWVADGSDKKIYGYDVANRNYIRLAGTIDVLDCAGNANPQGIWSDGATVWVGDDGEDRIYAYSMRDNLRDPSKEFDTLAGANNHDARGIWSDGEIMWVADPNNDWVYAYNMPDDPLLTPAPATPGTPSRPTVAHSALSGLIRVTWVPAASANIHRVYLTTTDGTESRYSGGDFCGDGHTALVLPYYANTDYQFRIIAGLRGPDGTVQWSDWSPCSKIINSDSTSTSRPAPLGRPTDLCMLSVSPGKLEPAFKTGERNYSATTVERRVTIDPASDQGASFTYSVNNVLTRDGDPTLPGFQADLECGANTVEIKVTSAAGQVSDTYTIDVTREAGIPPEAPVFSQVFGGPESLRLRFPPADSNCAGLTTWYYFRYSKDGVNWQVVEKRFHSTTFSISDLTPGTAYQVQAQARTKYGVSPWSATATGTPKIKPARKPADAVGVLGLSRAFVELLHDDLEIVYVVDTSGSMSGSKLDQLKIALTSVRDKQGVDNTAVALVRFSSGSTVLLDFVETGDGNWNQDWTNAINGLTATGGTEMYAAMRSAVGILPAQENCPTPTTCRSRDVVLMTDGQAGDDSLATTAIDEAVNKGVQVHTVAFGNDAEETTLQNIASQTGGTYVKVLPE